MYAAEGCDGDPRMSTVADRLKNTVQPDAPLPHYVASTPSLIRGAPIGVPWSTKLTFVRLLGTANASLVKVLANGRRIPVNAGREPGYPSWEAQVAMSPSQFGGLGFRLSEPTSPRLPRVPVQPLVETVTPVISVPECTP